MKTNDIITVLACVFGFTLSMFIPVLVYIWAWALVVTIALYLILRYVIATNSPLKAKNNKDITCGVYLLDVNNNLLICKPYGATRYWGGWSIPKGLPLGNELTSTTALRELKEETNIEYSECLFQFTLFQLPDQKYAAHRKVLKSFFIKTDYPQSYFNLRCNSVFVFNGQKYPEISEFKWVTLDEARKYLHESQVKNLEIIENKINTQTRPFDENL